MPVEHRGFFSYAQVDDALARRVWEALEAAGVPLWRDVVDGVPGQVLPRQIATAVKANPPLVALVTPAWLERPWTRAELQLALTQRPDTGVLPLLRVPTDDLPPELLPFPGIRLRDEEPGFAEDIEDLAATLRGEALGEVRRRRQRAGGEAALPDPGPCVGRDAVLRDLVEWLARGSGARPVLGPPGHGKSTLAVAALRHPKVAVRFGARRWMVRLDGAPSVEAAWAAVASRVAGHVGANARGAASDALGRGPGAVLLDNLETLWEGDAPGARAMMTELAGVPHLLTLATIRGAERPPGVAWGPTITMRPLLPADARAAFLEHADVDFSADPVLDRLVALAEGVPLVLHLLARASAGAPGCGWVLKRWDAERTALLHQGDERLDSLRVSLGLSVGSARMTGAARRLLGVMSGLPDGVAHTDLPSVLGPEALAAAQVLVRLGLAWHEGDRLRMLAPVRETVAVEWPPAAEDLAVAEAHYLGLARRGEELGRSTGAEAAARLAPEGGNLLTVVERGLGTQAWEPVGEAAYALVEYQRFTGAVRAEGLLEEARARARGDAGREARYAKRLGDLAFARSDNVTAVTRWEEALPLYARVADDRGRANCLWSLGNLAFRTSDNASASGRWGEALPLYVRAGSDLGRANCVKSLGDLAFQTGDNESASACWGEAQRLYSEVGDDLGRASCLKSLGDLAFRIGDDATAHARWEGALAICRRVGDDSGGANCLLCLGDLAFRTGDHEAARIHWEEALPVFTRVGNDLGRGNCLQSLGDLAYRGGDAASASARWEAALPLYARSGDDLGRANCLKRIGDLALRAGETAVARTRWEEALTLYRRLGARVGLGNCALSFARLARRLGRLPDARAHLEEARAHFAATEHAFNLSIVERELAELD